MLVKKGTSADQWATTIEKAARTRLSKTGYPLLKTITCSFHRGTLTLAGRVPSYYHKQLAQEAIRKVDSVETIVNQIEVRH